MQTNDHYWMQHALQLARHAGANNEVPVGAVLIWNNDIIGEGWNQPISTCDPTAHAEMVALRQGARYRNNYRVVDATLYVTLEPCVMCIGAMIHARIARLVFGAYDSSAYPLPGCTYLFAETRFNHHVVCHGGVAADQCALVLKEFFQKRRG